MLSSYVQAVTGSWLPVSIRCWLCEIIARGRKLRGDSELLSPHMTGTGGWGLPPLMIITGHNLSPIEKLFWTSIFNQNGKGEWTRRSILGSVCPTKLAQRTKWNLRETWTNRWRLRALNRLETNSRTDGRTDNSISWAPDGAKNETLDAGWFAWLGPCLQSLSPGESNPGFPLRPLSLASVNHALWQKSIKHNKEPGLHPVYDQTSAMQGHMSYVLGDIRCHDIRHQSSSRKLKLEVSTAYY